MGLANWLTILRILLIPVFVSLLVYRKPGPALVVFAGAALTDLLDGYIARRRGSQSRLGAFLDPMADKLLLTASFVTLTYLKVLPFWIAAVVISRDVILVVGTVLVYMLGARVHPRPTWAGKAATFFQILTVLTGLLARYLHLPLVPRGVLWLAAAFTVVSGLQYIVQGMKFLSAASGCRASSPQASPRGVVVARVRPRTAAAAAGLARGDRILAINGHALRDAIDFQFHAGDEALELRVERDGSALTLVLARRGADLGVELEPPRADAIATCTNKCVFCFIHQLPKGMRRSLYVKDDDFR